MFELLSNHKVDLPVYLRVENVSCGTNRGQMDLFKVKQSYFVCVFMFDDTD